MRALITGASSGIGRDIARELASRGCDLILAARRTDRLEALAEEFSVETEVISSDLSVPGEARRLYEATRDRGVDILVNCAGFGLMGSFTETDLQRELDMIEVNVTALHVLTKLYLGEFVPRGEGYVLNVASSAAFLPGPLLSAYYATKAYVLRLCQSVNGELKHSGSPVRITCLCPGPVRTEFDRVAGVKKSLQGMESADVARIAVRAMFRRKGVVTPGLATTLGRVAAHLLPDGVLTEFGYRTQNKKIR